MTDHDVLDTVRSLAVAAGPEADEALLDVVGDATFVLLGEASHGTREFYRERFRLTRRLVEDHGFCAVAVEADWPDAHQVGRWVRAASDCRDADEALGGFERFPTWMWRNTDVVELVEWLRAHNDTVRSHGPKVGFYGVDLYSLQRSIDEVLRYLDVHDPEAAARARDRYACFEQFQSDTHTYGLATAAGAADSCRDAVVAQLVELQRTATDPAGDPGADGAADAAFYAEQNARLVQNAEEYYRTMYGGRSSSWNLRDTHMADTLDALHDHLSARHGTPARIVVWEHNSHLGDARATEMGARGELNVGQLVRERHPGRSCHIGFTTHGGEVTAAHDWGDEPQRFTVRPALDGSWEDLFHRTGIESFVLPLGGRLGAGAVDALRGPRLERAIGVVYRPATERWSHYFEARIAEQFDAVVHIDRTTAVTPLERRQPTDDEVPETFPSSF